MSPAAEREWRQFRILARDGVRTLLNAAMLARDADPMQFALWTTVLVSTPPSLFAFSQMFKYASLGAAPAALVERVILADRMFFIVYSLIAAALLAAMTWDALYPDRDDQEIMGALPVRPRTMTAARLVAALGVATGFSFAINLPSAVFFAFVAVSHPSLGFLPLVFLAHILATVGGCVTVFTLLLITRGLLSLILGAAATDRLATALQLMAIVALVEVFFYLPSVLPILVQRMVGGGSSAAWLPSTWFGAVYNGLAGPRRQVYASEAELGVVVMTVALVIVIPIYLWPATLMARRALESQAGRRRRGHVGLLVRRAASALAWTPRGGSVARFSLLSLARSRRHMLVAVSYAGVGVAIALIQVIAAGLRGGVIITAPSRTLLAMPLVMMFFVVAGMRAAFKLPRDLDANWAFRLRAPTSLEASTGTWAALLVVGIAPIVALTGLGTQVAGWSAGDTALIMLLDGVSGLLLLECALYRWSLIPFACARPTGQDAVQTKWLAAIGPFLVFTVGGAILQLAALRSLRFAASMFVGLSAVTVVIGGLRRYRARRDVVPFDAIEGHLEVLNLSEALH